MMTLLSFPNFSVFAVHRRNLLVGMWFNTIRDPVKSIPKRVISSEPDPERKVAVLTRTMVRRMRLVELQLELEHRGILIESGKAKRDDLMLLLLDGLPSRRFSREISNAVSDDRQNENAVKQVASERPREVIGAPLTESVEVPIVSSRVKSNIDVGVEVPILSSHVKSIIDVGNHQNDSPVTHDVNRHQNVKPVRPKPSSESPTLSPWEYDGDQPDEVQERKFPISLSLLKKRKEENAKSLLEKQNEGCCKKYDISKVTIDSRITYVVAMYGIINARKSDIVNGTGIGIVLRENGLIIWMGNRLFSDGRTKYEAMYCSIILALRFSLLRFGIRNLVVQIPDENVFREINGDLLTKYSTHHVLKNEIVNLKNMYPDNNVIFESVPYGSNNRARKLAIEALRAKRPFTSNFGEDEADQRFRPLLFNDPMDVVALKLSALPKRTVDRVINPSKLYILRTDGSFIFRHKVGSHPGASGWALYDSNEQELWHGSKYLGEFKYGADIELMSLHFGLTSALSLGVEFLRCESDAKELILRVQSDRPSNSKDSNVLEETRRLVKLFKSVSFKYVPGDLNRREHLLCTEGKYRPTTFTRYYFWPISNFKFLLRLTQQQMQ